MKVGSKVEWKSQASGSMTQKTGEVVAVVPAGANPRTYADNLPIELRQLKRMFDGCPRGHESYLVKVVPGKTGKAKPVLYCPRVSVMVEISQTTGGKTQCN